MKCKQDVDYGQCILVKDHKGNHETKLGTRWGPDFEGGK